MSPIVKLNRATFHTGEPFEWVLLGEVHWRGGEYYWIWGLLKILGKTRDHVYLGICRSRIDRYYRSTCRPSVHRPVGWYSTSLSTKYRSTCQTKSVATRRRLSFQNSTYHRQSTDPPPTVYRYTTDTQYTADCWSQCNGRGVGQVSTNIPNRYRPIVATDVQPTWIAWRPAVGRLSIDLSTENQPNVGQHVNR